MKSKLSLKRFFLRNLFTIIFLFVFTLQFHLSGQNTLTYAYDADGNRIERLISMTRSATMSPDFFQEEISEQNIKIFPTPTRDLLTVEFPDSKIESGSVSLFNINGRKIAGQQISGYSVMLDLSGYSAGVYLLVIQVNEESSTWKIIKE